MLALHLNFHDYQVPLSQLLQHESPIFSSLPHPSLPFRDGTFILLAAKDLDSLAFLPLRHKVSSLGVRGERREMSSKASANLFLQHCAILFLEGTTFVRSKLEQRQDRSEK